MNRRELFLCVVTAVATISGCGSGDYKLKLGDDFTLYETSDIHIDIGDDRKMTAAVAPMVTQIGRTKRIIVCTRNNLMRRSPDDPNDTYEIPDPKSNEYWVIEVKDRKIHGPLDSGEYSALIRKLGESPPALITSQSAVAFALPK